MAMRRRLCNQFQFFSSTAANNFKTEPVSVKEVPTVTISKAPEPKEYLEKTPKILVDSPLARKLREHSIVKKFESKTVQTASNLNSFARGPLRSNLLVSFEVFKLIAAEQRLVPALSTWPHAKAAYLDTFHRLRSSVAALNSDKLAEMVKELTWGDLGRALRVTAEMAAFYYIGELLGMLLSLPFK